MNEPTLLDNGIKNGSKKLWNILNDQWTGRKSKTNPSFLEVDDSEFANYFNNYFISKLDKFTNLLLIRNKIMKGKKFKFKFKISV